MLCVEVNVHVWREKTVYHNTTLVGKTHEIAMNYFHKH